MTGEFLHFYDGLIRPRNAARRTTFRPCPSSAHPGTVAGQDTAGLRISEPPVARGPEHKSFTQDSGKHDTDFPYETKAKLLFNLLGTLKGFKVQKSYETDDHIPRNEEIEEAPDWPDRYLGPGQMKEAAINGGHSIEEFRG